MNKVRFQVAGRSMSAGMTPRTFCLVTDDWDDYHFKTSFQLLYFNENKEPTSLGNVKIGTVGMAPYSRTTLSRTFTSLDSSHFSVGQDREYYEKIMALGPSLGLQALVALGDIAASDERFKVAMAEEVTSTSLLRDLNEQVVLQQFRRIAQGGIVLTPYNFSYTYPYRQHYESPSLDFKVEPSSMPPSNVHVLIGSNGSGKTTLLTRMARALVESDDIQWGTFDLDTRTPSSFANVVTVSFSAFDPFAAIRPKGALGYSYVGLKNGDKEESVKTSAELVEDFVTSLFACTRGRRRVRWLAAMATLNADPLLHESGIRDLLVDSASPLDPVTVAEAFESLSSGHKIVVLTVTRLVELVEEQTLALLDEPEAHLHPPLLAAFTRALSNLLEDRNGVAIIATHSPVVLQEVPESCVWTIRRSGAVITPERLDMETFGEGVGTLTASVFGLEVTSTGYHQLLENILASNDGSYDMALRSLNGKVGGEGRSILRSLASRHRG